MVKINHSFVEEYGCDELYLPCKDGSDILLCKIGKESSWLDDQDVQLLAALLVRNNLFSSEQYYGIFLEEIDNSLLPDDSLPSEGIAGNSFFYNKEENSGPFIICFDRNGGYDYSPATISSFIGSGQWTIYDDTLVLTERSYGKCLVNCLKINGDDLIYDAAASDCFCQCGPKNGDEFTVINDETVARHADPKVYDIKPSKEGVSEFVEKAQKKSYKVTEENCYNITPDDERFEKSGYKIFKDNETSVTYIITKRDWIYEIGFNNDGYEVTSLAIADMDLDGYDELYYTYSSNSGRYRSRIGCFGGFCEDSAHTNPDSDMVFVTDNGRLELYSADIKAKSNVEIESVPKEKLGEAFFDMSSGIFGKIVFREIGKKFN